MTESWGGVTIASELAFASVTSYQAVAPGVETVTVTAGTGAGASDVKSTVALTAGSIHTLVGRVPAPTAPTHHLPAAPSTRPPATT